MTLHGLVAEATKFLTRIILAAQVPKLDCNFNLLCHILWFRFPTHTTLTPFIGRR